MRILVTGVAGRVGTSLALRLLRSGHQVRGTVRPGGRSPHRSIADDIEVVEASLADTAALTRAVSQVDVVVHLAARMTIGDTPADEFVDVNAGGTLRLLEAAVSQAKPVRRFVLASTDNVYRPGVPTTVPITELQPAVPGDYYGMSKVLAEQVVVNYHVLHGIEYTILRLGSVIAPDESIGLFRRDWVRTFLVAHAQAGRRSNLWPLFAACGDLAHLVDAATAGRDGNPAVDLAGPRGEPWAIHLTDVRDAVAGTELAIDHPHAANEVFNILGPRTTTTAEAAAVMRKLAGVDAVTVRLPVTLAFEVATAKARRLLGYRPRWDYEATLRTALASSGAPPTGDVPVGEA
ncbi:NAD-dependent epimerase/dehydratase family protein [Jiangella muralis]|uniref:NAD-dependent epimerase/dehydratase family protein n=1 Tax=Jiangella muralis TaxID=702383 RepID=UPI0009F958B5|nr:NAD(P)-dependent oxidoreductase [Jiangella muralis]